MSWIKMRHNLDTDPDVLAISEATGLDEFGVIGRLWKVWTWADQHSISGNAVRVTDVTLDRFTGVTGFAKAMRAVGWLDGESGNLTFPRFERHNGQTAKNRGLTANRVASHRNASTVTNVTQLPLPDKIREDKNSTLSPLPEPRLAAKRQEPPVRPTQSEIEEFCVSLQLPRSDGEAMFLHWQEKGWGKVKDWKLTIRKWKSFGYLPSQKGRGNGTHQRSNAESRRNVGTANEGRSSQYAGVGKVQ